MLNAINIQNENSKEISIKAIEIEMDMITNTNELIIKEIIPIQYKLSFNPKYANKVLYNCKICEKMADELKNKYIYYFKFQHKVSFENYIILVCTECLESIKQVYITITNYNTNNVFGSIIENIFFIDWKNFNCNVFVFLPENIQKKSVCPELHLKDLTNNNSTMCENLKLIKAFDINLIIKCFMKIENFMNYDHLNAENLQLCMDMINSKYEKYMDYGISIYYIIMFKYEIYYLLWQNMKLPIYFEKLNKINYIKSYKIENISDKKYIIKNIYSFNIEFNLILLHTISLCNDIKFKKLIQYLNNSKINKHTISCWLKQYFEFSEAKQVEIQLEFEKIRNNERSYYESINWLFNIIDYEKKLQQKNIAQTNFISKIRNLERKSLILDKYIRNDFHCNLLHTFLYEINRNE